MARTNRNSSEYLDTATDIDDSDGRRFYDLENGSRRYAPQDPERDFFEDLDTIGGYSILDNPDGYESEEDEEVYPREE